MHSTNDCFTAGIKALRKHGWFKRQVGVYAPELGYTATHISQVFTGKRAASQKLMDAIAEEIGVSPEGIIRIGRELLETGVFFPLYGQVEHLKPHSEEQADAIQQLTNRAYGMEKELENYRPRDRDKFLAGELSPHGFYSSYDKEIVAIIKAAMKYMKR